MGLATAVVIAAGSWALAGSRDGGELGPSAAMTAGPPGTGTPTTSAQEQPDNGLVTVPNVLNMVLDDASAILRRAGFSSIPYLYECYGSDNIGGVVRQDPGAGARIAKTTPVHLYLQAKNC